MFRHYDFGQVATTEINTSTSSRSSPCSAADDGPAADTECTNIPWSAGVHVASRWCRRRRRRVRAYRPWSLAGGAPARSVPRSRASQLNDFQAAVPLGLSLRLPTVRPAICSTATPLPSDATRPVALPAAPASGQETAADSRSPDKESWPPNRQMLGVSRGDPGVSFLTSRLWPQLPHHRRYPPDALQWLDNVRWRNDSQHRRHVLARMSRTTRSSCRRC